MEMASSIDHVLRKVAAMAQLTTAFVHYDQQTVIVLAWALGRYSYISLASNEHIELLVRLQDPPGLSDGFLHVIISQALEILMKRKYGFTADVRKYDAALKDNTDFQDILEDLLVMDNSLLSKEAIVDMAKHS